MRPQHGEAGARIVCMALFSQLVLHDKAVTATRSGMFPATLWCALI